MNNLIKQIIESKFNFNIDIEDNERQILLSKSKYNSITQKKLIEYMVDLGLPSGTLWHKYNLDVNSNQLSKPKNWYGKYYAWGELEGNKTDKGGWITFEYYNYKFGNESELITKYCNKSYCGLNGFTDNLTQLLPEDDAAYQNKKLYNFKFHIPTKEQCEELINCTKNYWVNNYDPNKLVHNPKNDGGIKGLNGYIFEGNRNTIFIPAAGYYYYKIDNVGLACLLWTSSLDLDNPSQAYYLSFNSDSIGIYSSKRYDGLSIRPVLC